MTRDEVNHAMGKDARSLATQVAGQCIEKFQRVLTTKYPTIPEPVIQTTIAIEWLHVAFVLLHGTSVGVGHVTDQNLTQDFDELIQALDESAREIVTRRTMKLMRGKPEDDGKLDS